MKEIFITGYLKNVAISSNTVYNLIGNLDLSLNQISFKENDGTEITITIKDDSLEIKRKTATNEMLMPLISNQHTKCLYDVDNIKLNINVYTKYLNITNNSLEVHYLIEDKDLCEYKLSWEANDEIARDKESNQE